MTEQKKYDHQIKIERIACPLHVLQMKKGLDQIAVGETLLIKSNAYVAPELLAAAKQIGTKVNINHQHEIFVTK